MRGGEIRKPLKSEHNGAAPTREDGRIQIEVHVAGACIRLVNGRWKLLAAQRTDKRSLYPKKWECGGGQVRRGEDFVSAIKRQIEEEFGLSVVPYQIIEAYSIPIPGQQSVIPGLRWLCIANAGRVRLHKREFSRYQWVDFPVPKLDWIPGLRETLNRIVLPPVGEFTDAGSGIAGAEPKPPGSIRPGFVSKQSAS